LAEARELERRFSPLFEANFWESNPGPVKTVLKLMGKCGDHLRFAACSSHSGYTVAPGTACR